MLAHALTNLAQIPEKFAAKALSLRLIPLIRVLRVHSSYARRTAKFEKRKRVTFVFFKKT